MAKPKRKRTEPEPEARLERAEERISRLELTVERIGSLLVSRATTPATRQYRAGRWHLRDGDGYDKPPY